MKFRRFHFLSVLVLALAPLASTTTAAEKTSSPASDNKTDRLIAAVTAADDERLAATKAGDKYRLDAIFSDALHYAHSSGKIDTKASYMASLVTRTTIYESFDYQERKFTLLAPGIAQMTGRVLIKATNNGARSDNDLNFLAIWREENGKWRFIAWQSCKNLPAATKK
jgi:hypothetical protein